MKFQLIKDKFKAFAIHICISAVILAGLLSLIIFWWYPGIWFAIDGGWQGTRIMVLVDMVLGPVLTLIIFNPAKTRKHIIFDLSCIGLIQVAALAWGINAVHSQRPLAIVYWDGAVYSVDAQELAKFDTSASDLNQFDGKLPIIVGARKPENAEERQAVAMSMFLDAPSLYADIERFSAIGNYREEMLDASLDIQKLANKNPEIADALSEFLTSRSELKADDLIYLPFNGRFGNYHLILDQNGNILGRLPA